MVKKIALDLEVGDIFTYKKKEYEVIWRVSFDEKKKEVHFDAKQKNNGIKKITCPPSLTFNVK